MTRSDERHFIHLSSKQHPDRATSRTKAFIQELVIVVHPRKIVARPKFAVPTSLNELVVSIRWGFDSTSVSLDLAEVQRMRFSAASAHLALLVNKSKQLDLRTPTDREACPNNLQGPR